MDSATLITRMKELSNKLKENQGKLSTKAFMDARALTMTISGVGTETGRGTIFTSLDTQENVYNNTDMLVNAIDGLLANPVAVSILAKLLRNGS